mmetsp:Transcript_5479/g.11926  ORF Transcript_5479/g.11926 Transcript_5479/m.11926 type:complete len:455 (+) Transcript_5479:106-1470(+)
MGTVYEKMSRSPQQRSNFNSARTTWTLSVLLLLTLFMQIILIAYHDDFVLHLNALEGEMSENMSSLNSIAADAINTAFEYNDPIGNDSGAAHHDGLASEVQNNQGISKYSSYSMEPKDILKRAGVDYSSGFVPSISVREARAAETTTKQLREAELPTLDEIQAMYGNRSYVLGLDRCKDFKEAVHPENRLMGPAGIFNSATNLLNKLLKLNCVNTARLHKSYKAPTGMLLQAPWGKHNPVTWRLHHQAAAMWNGVIQKDFLPVVMIKDPITWMASMCRHPYEARWRHTQKHCPNLVPNEWDRGRNPGKGTMGIKVKFATKRIGDEPIPDKKNKTFIEYTSLIELWSVWYRDWYNANFPRLMVRFEDLLFHAEDTVSQVCACGGGTMKPRFRYVEDSAKGQSGPHAGSAGFLASLITYGNSTLRMKGILTDERDVEYARQHLDQALSDLFGYAPI